MNKLFPDLLKSRWRKIFKNRTRRPPLILHLRFNTEQSRAIVDGEFGVLPSDLGRPDAIPLEPPVGRGTGMIRRELFVKNLGRLRECEVEYEDETHLWIRRPGQYGMLSIPKANLLSRDAIVDERIIPENVTKFTRRTYIPKNHPLGRRHWGIFSGGFPFLRRIDTSIGEISPEIIGITQAGAIEKILPPSDLGRPDAISLESPTWQIPPEPENWAEQNRRINDLIAGQT